MNLSTQTSFLFSSGHTSNINCLKRIDANRYASGSTDLSVRIWNSVTGANIKVMTLHTARVNCLEVLPDSNQLVSGSDDNSIRFWNLTSYGSNYVITNAHWSQSVLCLKRLAGGLLASGAAGNGANDGPNLRVKFILFYN